MPPRAVLQALDQIWAALEPLELPMALLGGLALSVWKHVRATQDVDLLVGLGETSVEDVLASATKAGFRPKRIPPTLSLGSFQVIQLEFEPQDALHREGLRYRHAKELAAALERPPLSASLPRLWQAFQAIEPEQVKGAGGKQLVDVIALVRHAIDPNQPLCPIGTTVQERFDQWLVEQEATGATFTPQQRQWLVAIKEHIAGGLSIDQDDFDQVPFNQFGGLGKAHELFGDRLPALLEELNARLAA